MGDRRAAALTRSVPIAGALVLCMLLAAGCTSNRGKRKSAAKKPAARPAVAETTSGVRGDFASYDVVEIAVELPGGMTSGSVKRAFREAVYRGLIAKGYSPLALDYVDATRGATSARTFRMRSAITEVRRSSGGGVLATGWLGLVRPGDDDGEETSLFLAEVEELALPPEKGEARTDGGPATGTRLANALLRELPAR